MAGKKKEIIFIHFFSELFPSSVQSVVTKIWREVKLPRRAFSRRHLQAAAGSLTCSSGSFSFNMQQANFSASIFKFPTSFSST